MTAFVCEHPVVGHESSNLDALVDALYATVSGPVGQEPDWARERSLYLPDALLVRATQVDDDTPQAAVMSVEEFIVGCRGYLLENDFYEREVERTTSAFGNLAHVLSTYQTSKDPDGHQPIARGVNSLQLYNDGSRWWIVSAVWEILPAESH